MALSITNACVNCYACLDVCPSGAVQKERPHFRIAATSCTECDGAYAAPQCASICPVEGAILDATGMAINPPGSLTGSPAERLQRLTAAQP